MSKPTAHDLRQAFDAHTELTVGVEEELMLLDPETLDLAPRADEVLALLGGDQRFKRELPAAQLEIVTAPHATTDAVIAELAAGRRDLAAATSGLVRLGASGVHPFAHPEGELNEGGRYDATLQEYGRVARRQLVFALQVHVAVPGADRALAVYDGLRSYLPEIAAMSANAPLYDGEDTGLASIRPKIAEQLPRQGVPPALGTWEAFAGELQWGVASGWMAEAATWWWELRPHPRIGTLELRVPDAQTSVREAAGVVAFAHALVGWLAQRADAGDLPPAAPTWRVEENRWSACRSGLDAPLADLVTGARTPARERLGALLDELEPVAQALGCDLAPARELAVENGADRQRRFAKDSDVHEATRWLADTFVPASVGAGASAGTVPPC